MKERCIVVTFRKKNVMKTQENTIRIGLQMFGAVVAYFLLMKLFELEKFTELRFFNILIVAYFTNKLARLNASSKEVIGYLPALGSLFVANTINVMLSVLALFFYMLFVDAYFIDYFSNGILIGHSATVSKVCLGIFMEGVAASAIMSFATMQYWKGVRETTLN